MTKVFILGNPRSGTSLFRLMLQQHQAIIAPPEGGFAQWLLPKYEDWTQLDSTSACVHSFIADVLASKKMETWDLDPILLQTLITKNVPHTYGELVSLVYQAYDLSNLTEVVIDKNTYYIKHLPELLRIWPESRFIHLVRDGRDVACSYMEVNRMVTQSPYRPHLPNEVALIAREWQNNNQTIVSFLERHENPSITVRYEELLLSPVKCLTDVCSFLQLPFQENMLDFYKDQRTKYQEPKATLDWKLETKNPLNTSRLGKYKSELDTEQLATFTAHAKPMLSYFNYE